MYTSIVLIALTGFFTNGTAEKESPVWMEDYKTALTASVRQQKPLAIFLAEGRQSWDQVSRDGNLGKDVNRILHSDYVCVYIDTSKAAGQRFASVIDVPQGLGMVLGDRSGEFQAFRHAGQLTNETLEGFLRKYANREVVVQATETTGRQTVHYYEGAVPSQPVYSTPPSFNTYIGNSVPAGRSC